MSESCRDAIVGCLLGTAIGDAIGVPYENLSPRRVRRFTPHVEKHSLLFGRGMVSDDTEHACMVAQALIVSAGQPDAFLESLAWRLRFWFLGTPAGMGYATLRACLKLWLGFPGSRSGVFSAGNGPAMRSPLLGVCCGDLPTLRTLVRASTRITHTDPKAEYGALAVALAAHLAATPVADADLPEAYLQLVRQTLDAGAAQLLGLLDKAVRSAQAGQLTQDFAVALGLWKGVGGYIYHTVPVVIQAWLRAPSDYRGVVSSLVECGGDADTTAAIAGGILGARLGRKGLPQDWLAGLWEWPCTVDWMERLGTRLAEVCATGVPGEALPLSVPGLLLRNFFFLTVVVLHALRRWLPPW